LPTAELEKIYFSVADPDTHSDPAVFVMQIQIQGFDDKNWEKFTTGNKFIFF
jgi:hypothetical protein